MPQSHPTTGPVRFLSPVRFLARKAEWSGRRMFTSVLFSWSHQATGPVRLDTAVYLWFGWIIRMTPRVPHAVPVGASCGSRTGIFNVFHILRGLCGTRKGAVRCPYGHARELTQPELAKSRTGVVFCRTGPVRFPHGLFMGCLKSLNPYGARKLIMHALKLYAPRTGRQNSHGPVRAPWVDVRFLFKTTCEPPGNSPYGARECDVTEALVGNCGLIICEHWVEV